MEDGLGRLLMNQTKYHPFKIREQAEKFSESKFKSRIREIVK